ncbi:MAG: Flp pilus assembly complex ATPase component TadA [Candidatus Omnitrophica bacterium]|nr:Flp pilus assembly complex ATPase component TadA [Candidatus Omnitrophota bacterium]
MSSLKERLSTALVDKGLLTKERAGRLLKETAAGGKEFAKLLIEREGINEETLVGVMAEELGIPAVSLAKYRLDPAVAQLVPERLARQHLLVPIAQFGQRLVIAIADPLNVFALDDLRTVTHHAVDPVLAQESEIRRAIARLYGGKIPATEEGSTGNGASPPEAAEPLAESEREGQLRLSDEADSAPIVKVINLMIVEALQKRASDIHLEPMADVLRVRYRIDGQLKEAHRFPKTAQSAILTRLKIISGLDITEWRLPQDGRFKVRLDAREVDFRVSVLPLTGGGKVVLRVLDKGSLSVGLDHLGFLPESVEAFGEVVKRPYGMILVTGPTGSGKSTTLYSILSQLNLPTRHIITIEDPVEYQVEGMTQVQVNPEIGLTFASGLRSTLRQNPDIVMIGEVRDFETADIAMKASLTGHLVLSTLHTNDAATAVPRLVDMGVEPFLVASGVTLIEAQRLVRKLCPKCRKAYEPAPELVKRLGRLPKPEATFYQAAGCRSCQGGGYHGRMGILEVLVVDERIRELIVSKAPSWEIKRYAIEQRGMTTLREDGLKKAAMGLTTLEEVLQVTSEE